MSYRIAKQLRKATIELAYPASVRSVVDYILIMVCSVDKGFTVLTLTDWTRMTAQLYPISISPFSLISDHHSVSQEQRKFPDLLNIREKQKRGGK